MADKTKDKSIADKGDKPEKPQVVDPVEIGDAVLSLAEALATPRADDLLAADEKRTRSKIFEDLPVLAGEQVRVSGETYTVVGPGRGKEWVVLCWRERDGQTTRRAYGTFHRDQIVRV